MIPTVFISSTVDDLRHIRDAVRATVEEVGYQPVMSEYGEIGYMGGDAAEDACYRTVPECQLVVLIIGKRYGSAAKNDPNKTITELEFEKALGNGSRIITLVDKEVLGFKKVFDANPHEKKVKYPGMNDPGKTFEFIARVSRSAMKNAILPYSTASDVRGLLKRQFAILFHDLLEARVSPAIASINDILCEVKTMRQAMTKEAKPDVKFLAAIRFLMDDANDQFRNVIKDVTSGSVEAAISKIEENIDFKTFLEASQIKYHVEDMGDGMVFHKFPKCTRGCRFVPHPCAMPEPGEKLKEAKYAWCEPGEMFMNQVAFDYYCTAYKAIKRKMEMAI